MPNQIATSTEHQIVEEITAHINKSPYRASDWYAGITENINQRLFGDHAVTRRDSWYIYRRANNSYQARNIERYLLNWGCDGGDGGGDQDAVFIYAYHKTPGTRR
jgi:hypothetical protein